MSALTTRDALAKALYVTRDTEGREERARAWERFPTIRAHYLAKAEPLLASGAVIDAAALADDDVLVRSVMHGAVLGVERAQVRATLRALAAYLGESA